MKQRKTIRSSILSSPDQAYFPQLTHKTKQITHDFPSRHTPSESVDMQAIIQNTPFYNRIKLDSRNNLRRVSMPTKRELFNNDTVIIPIDLKHKKLKKKLPPLSDSTSDGADITYTENRHLNTEAIYTATNQVKKSIYNIKKLLRQKEISPLRLLTRSK